MVEAVRKLAQLGVQLTVEERNLLSVAYKVGATVASQSARRITGFPDVPSLSALWFSLDLCGYPWFVREYVGDTARLDALLCKRVIVSGALASRRTSGQSLWLLRHYIGCFDMHVCLRPPCFLAIFLSKAFAVPFPSLVVSRAMFHVSSLSS